MAKKINVPLRTIYICQTPYWVDDNDNKWTRSSHSKEDAAAWSSSLTECYGCYNCRDCVNCLHCENSEDCSHCSRCIHCSFCDNCERCDYCKDCLRCQYCNHCVDCTFCTHCCSCEAVRMPAGDGRCWGLSGVRNLTDNYNLQLRTPSGLSVVVNKDFEPRIEMEHSDWLSSEGYPIVLAAAHALSRAFKKEKK